MEVARVPELSSSVQRIQQELSKGYYMKPWWEIYFHQTASRVLLHLGKERNIDFSWLFYTMECPEVPQINEIENAIREAEEFLKTYRPRFDTFSKQYEAEKTDLINKTFLFNPSRSGSCESVPLQSVSNLCKFLPQLLMICQISEKEEEVLLPKVHEFLSNPEYLDSVPCINVFCSLWASLVVNERNREWQSGDLLDAFSLACAIYNCSLVTTDANMKNHIVSRLRLGDKWGSQIFSQSTEDIEKLMKVISQ